MARIGNDREPPTFYEDSGPVLAAAFLPLVEEKNPRLASGALKALYHSSGIPVTAELAAMDAAV